MSTLTKILIVLLTLSSIFLSGIVVTYIGNADNYKQKYETLKSEGDALRKKVDGLTKQANEKISEKRQLEDKLNAQVSSLKVQIDDLKTRLASAEREKAAMVQKINSWAGIVENFTKTTDNQRQTLDKTLDELNQLRAEQIEQRKQVTDAQTALIQKTAELKALEEENKLLLEQKARLQTRLDEIINPGAVSRPAPVVISKPDVPVVSSQPGGAVLAGVVTAVDLKNSMASISIGSGDGVREGMKFHAIRNDEFICDILIIDAGAEGAVGVLDLVQKQPKVGDSVTTNL